MSVAPLFAAAVDVELLGMIAVIGLAVLIVGLLAVGGFLVIRDTVRQRGNWGITFKVPDCEQCGTRMPAVRVPANRRQALWGGWTCPECGLELDKWGRPVEGQSSPAKWKALRAADEAERPRRRDERIRDVDDRAQRGDAS